ncbi:MAG: ABC transporter permease subunit [Candidatus Thorarchaeota archaeon]
MALEKPMIVARSDLRMALQVKYVKFGLIGMAALGPVLSILSIVGFIMAVPAEGVVLFLSPMVSSLLGIMSIIPASLISANSLVGEKEQNTLEPLLCTPLTDTELLLGKLLGSFIPSFVLLIGGLIVTVIGSNLLLLMLGLPTILVPDLAGLFLLLTAAPVMMVAVVFTMILISGRVKRVYEAYQTSGAVVMVFIIPMVLPMTSLSDSGFGDPIQLSNLIWLTNIVTLLIAVVLMLVSGVLALKRFNRDRMISQV